MTGGDRLGGRAWLLLALTDCVAIASLARCFKGAGELALLVPVCLAAHLFAGGGRRLAGRSRRAGRSGATSGTLLTLCGWLVALLVTGAVPLVAFDWHSFVWGLPLSGTWHLTHSQLSSAWSIFANRVAPVAQTPGLVAAAAWASGAVAVAAEVLYADSALPAVLALVPAFDVVVFTGTLGTTSGRSVELVAVAGLSIAFLFAAQSDRPSVSAIVLGRAGEPEGRALGESEGAARPFAWLLGRGKGGGRKWLPGATLAAVVAAGLLGPALPGATSSPLVAWHGTGRPTPGGSPGPGSGGVGGGIEVSNLVQVAEEEVKNSNGLLFTVFSRQQIRDRLTTLDHFNGVRWSEQGGSGRSTVQTFSGPSPARVEGHPPAASILPDGGQQVEQVIEIDSLAGHRLPSPGKAVGVDGAGEVSVTDGGSSLVARSGLHSGLTYAVRSVLPPPSAALLERNVPYSASPGAQYLQLPQPVPNDIVNLAHEIVAGSTSLYQEAQRLQDYFRYGNGFVYRLPRVTPSGAISDTSQSYRALRAFLFSKRVGYCQQFATAFAVLARVDLIPVRIAVGFLPGKVTGKDQYVVTGADVHAWPEVYMGRYGWVSFEPTPGTAPVRQVTKPTVPIQKPVVIPQQTSGNYHPAHNFKGPAAGARSARHPGGPASHSSASAPLRKGASGAVQVVLALLALGIAWCAGVPLLRRARRSRRRRDVRRATFAAWQSALNELSAAGAHRRLSETHSEFVDRVREVGILSAPAMDALRSLARRMDLTMYAPPRVGTEVAQRADARAAWAESATVRRSARRRIPRFQQLVMALDPRDFIGTA